MASDQEKFERQERAARLKQARKLANISGAKGVFEASEGAVDINTYKGHESGRNGFSVSDGRRYAELFGVPLTWLYLGIGRPDDFSQVGLTERLRKVVAQLSDAPTGLQEQIATSIEFLLLPTQVASPPSPAPRRDLPEPASRRRATAP